MIFLLKGRVCCKAMVAECGACLARMTVSEYCESNMDVPGCAGKCFIYFDSIYSKNVFNCLYVLDAFHHN